MDNAPTMPERAPSRAAIAELEGAMRAMPADQVELGLRHHFAPGLYARELTIPAGCAVVGKIHRERSLFIMVSGDLEIRSEFGCERLTGFNVRMTEPGMKRAVYAHADTIVLNFHPTEETNLEAIEAAVIAPDYDAIASDQSMHIEGAGSCPG